MPELEISAPGCSMLSLHDIALEKRVCEPPIVS